MHFFLFAGKSMFDDRLTQYETTQGIRQGKVSTNSISIVIG